MSQACALDKGESHPRRPSRFALAKLPHPCMVVGMAEGMAGIAPTLAHQPSAPTLTPTRHDGHL